MPTALSDALGSLPLATTGTNWELVLLVTIAAAVILTIAWLALR